MAAARSEAREAKPGGDRGECEVEEGWPELVGKVRWFVVRFGRGSGVDSVDGLQLAWFEPGGTARVTAVEPDGPGREALHGQRAGGAGVAGASGLGSFGGRQRGGSGRWREVAGVESRRYEGIGEPSTAAPMAGPGGAGKGAFGAAVGDEGRALVAGGAARPAGSAVGVGALSSEGCSDGLAIALPVSAAGAGASFGEPSGVEVVEVCHG